MQVFKLLTSALQAKADSWELGFKTIYRDRIIAYTDHLEPGVYSLHYLVRSVTPGTYSVLVLKLTCNMHQKNLGDRLSLH